MDAVLPLTLRDYDRSLLLRRSLARFFEGLGTVFMVVKDSELAQFQDRLAKLPEDGIRVSLLSEAEAVPELRHFPTLKGWYKQQLIKLAIFERVSSEFYVTFDADVIATRRTSPERLAPSGRALCTLIREDGHADWYRHSERVLGKKLNRPGMMHNVTPAILATGAVRELSEHLTERWQRRIYRDDYRGFLQRLAALRFGKDSRLAGWRLYLASAVPWTEYAIYYGFLEATGRFDQYHQHSERCVYDVSRSIWRRDTSSFAHWDPTPLFEGEGPPYFVVVQSNTRIAPQAVLDKLAPHLGGA